MNKKPPRSCNKGHDTDLTPPYAPESDINHLSGSDHDFSSEQKEDDKLVILLDVLDHPDNFSDEEITRLFADPEIRDHYKTIALLKAALLHKAAKNPETFLPGEAASLPAELPHPAATPVRSRLFSRFPMRKVAVAAIITVVSLVAVATVVGVKVASLRKVQTSQLTELHVQTPEAALPASDTSTQENSIPEEAAESVLFENQPLTDILYAMKEHYGVNVIFRSEGPKNIRLYLRWNPERPLPEIVELLNNFRQFSITLSGDTLTVDTP